MRDNETVETDVDKSFTGANELMEALSEPSDIWQLVELKANDIVPAKPGHVSGIMINSHYNTATGSTHGQMIEGSVATHNSLQILYGDEFNAPLVKNVDDEGISIDGNEYKGIGVHYEVDIGTATVKLDLSIVDSNTELIAAAAALFRAVIGKHADIPNIEKYRAALGVATEKPEGAWNRSVLNFTVQDVLQDGLIDAGLLRKAFELFAVEQME